MRTGSFHISSHYLAGITYELHSVLKETARVPRVTRPVVVYTDSHKCFIKKIVFQVL